MTVRGAALGRDAMFAVGFSRFADVNQSRAPSQMELEGGEDEMPCPQDFDELVEPVM